MEQRVRQWRLLGPGLPGLESDARVGYQPPTLDERRGAAGTTDLEPIHAGEVESLLNARSAVINHSLPLHAVVRNTGHRHSYVTSTSLPATDHSKKRDTAESGISEALHVGSSSFLTLCSFVRTVEIPRLEPGYWSVSNSCAVRLIGVGYPWICTLHRRKLAPTTSAQAVLT